MATRTELLTIERETSGRREGGGLAASWASIGDIWAAAQWVGGGEAEQRGAVRETTRYRFTVLSGGAEALGLTVKDRILWNGVRYNIREVPRRLPRGIETEIIAESGVGETQ